MVEESKDVVNPEGEDQPEQYKFITAKLILSGSLDTLDSAIIQDVEVPDLILPQLENGIFAQFFDSVKDLNSKEKSEGSEQRSIWIDVRGSEDKGTKIKTK